VFLRTIAIGHLIAAVVVGLLDLGKTRWLRKKLDEESEQVGRLI
jgi:hypothetical protein